MMAGCSSGLRRNGRGATPLATFHLAAPRVDPAASARPPSILGQAPRGRRPECQPCCPARHGKGRRVAITPKILAVAGSARRGSWNKPTARIAADGAREAGADSLSAVHRARTKVRDSTPGEGGSIDRRLLAVSRRTIGRSVLASPAAADENTARNVARTSRSSN
jgi:hypothetical protein